MSTVSDVLDGTLKAIGGVVRDTDTLPLLREVNRQLEVRFGQYFAAEAGPEGAWAPNAMRTVEKKGHGIVLFETGALEESLARRNTHTVMSVTRNGAKSRLFRGTKRPWARVNNYGSTKRRIPARRFNGITRQEAKVIAKDAAAFYFARLRSQIGALR